MARDSGGGQADRRAPERPHRRHDPAWRGATATSWTPARRSTPAGRTKLWVSSIWVIFAWISTPASVEGRHVKIPTVLEGAAPTEHDTLSADCHPEMSAPASPMAATASRGWSGSSRRDREVDGEDLTSLGGSDRGDGGAKATSRPTLTTRARTMRVAVHGTSGALSTSSSRGPNRRAGPSGSARRHTSRREPCSWNPRWPEREPRLPQWAPPVRKEMSNPTVAAPARPTPRSTRPGSPRNGAGAPRASKAASSRPR